MRIRTLGDMIAGGGLVHVRPGVSVRDATRLMAARHIGAVLVIGDGGLLGIFTERDAMNRVLAPALDPDATQVSEVMTVKPMTGETSMRAVDALRLLHENGFRHLPVVGDDGSAIGIVSLRDFVGEEMAEVEQEMQFEMQIYEGSTS